MFWDDPVEQLFNVCLANSIQYNLKNFNSNSSNFGQIKAQHQQKEPLRSSESLPVHEPEL